MVDSDSGSDCGDLVRMSSTTSLPSVWDTVPDATDFKFKGRLHGPAGGKSKFVYTLKKGLELPYSTRISGLLLSGTRALRIIILYLELKVTFSKALEPQIDGYVVRKDGAFWTFVAESVASKSNCSTTRGGNGDDSMNSSAEVLDKNKDHLDDMDTSGVSEGSVEVEDPDLEKAFVRVDSTG